MFFQRLYRFEFTFMSLIHFKLSFVSSMRQGLMFIFFHVDFWLFQHYLLKSHPFLIGLLWHLCLKPRGHLSVDLSVPGLSELCSIHLFLYPMPVLHCPDFGSFTVSLEIRQSKSPNFVLLLQYCCGCSRSFAFSFLFQNQLFFFFKNQHEYDWECVQSKD